MKDSKMPSIPFLTLCRGRLVLRSVALSARLSGVPGLCAPPSVSTNPFARVRLGPLPPFLLLSTMPTDLTPLPPLNYLIRRADETDEEVCPESRFALKLTVL
jgi:hypothetical protein